MTDEARQVHERIDLVLDRISEVKADVARLDERSKNTDKKLGDICKRLSKDTLTRADVGLIVAEHERGCVGTKQGFVNGGVWWIRQHPIVSLSVIVLAAVQAAKEAGLL